MPSADAMEHWAANRNQPNSNIWNNAIVGTAPAAYETYYNQALLNQQLAANRANYGVQNRYNQQDIGFANQDYNLAMQGVGLDRNRIQQQANALGRDYATDVKGLNLNYDQYARQMAMQPQLRGLQNQLFGLSESDINRESQRSIRGLTSDATARGALGSKGYQDSIGYEQAELADALSGLGVNRKQYDIQQTETEAKVNDQYKQYQLDFEKLNNSLRKGNEGIQQADQALNLQAQKLGLSNQQAVANINRAIEQLGISYAGNANQIALELAKQDAGLQTRLPSDILNLILKMAGG